MIKTKSFSIDEIPEIENEIKMKMEVDGVELTIREEGYQLKPVFINFIEVLKMNGEQFENKYGKVIGFQYRSVKTLAITVIGGLVEKAKKDLTL